MVSPVEALGGQEPGRPVRDPQALRRAPVAHQGRGHDFDLVTLAQHQGRSKGHAPLSRLTHRKTDYNTQH